jgi:asparagine synthase (glutamine-hydrolysing)
MCGLVGFISSNRQNSVVESMLEVLRYRGPDDTGTLVEAVADSFVHLGQNRLSIQDVSKKGHQPFVSDCGNYILVFNGEVYNFKIIREELETLGQKFVSGSDTEVILYAYKHWGMDCLEKFIGMFAFAILDKIEQKIFLVRDRAGVKPLYYHVGKSEFLFASELKSFHQHSGFVKRLNKEVLPYYFQFGYIPAPHTIFEKTHKLLPGHYVEIDINDSEPIDFKVIKYWDVEEFYKKDKFTDNEEAILSNLEDLITDSVNLRMISDVPVGVFLSGGYDSTLVTALLAQNKQRKLHTFTIGFEDKKYNEAEHAKTIAKYFGTEHSELYISNQDLLDKVSDLPFHYDEPFADSSALPTMMVAEMAKQDVTVALSADGGDEVFCGYSKYFMLQKFESVFASSLKKNTVNALMKVIPAKMVGAINSLLPKSKRFTNIEDKYAKFKRAMSAKSLSDMFCNASSYVNPQQVKQFLKIKPELFGTFDFEPELSFIDNMMLTDYRSFMVDDVLVKVDRACMSNSLEGREPLLDHRIIEFMAQVPNKLKYKNKQGKYLARQILYKHIPAEMVDKPKSGFQIPLVNWLKNELKLLVDEHIQPEKLDEELFDISELMKLKSRFYAGDNTLANVLWFVLMFQMWREQWDV